MKASQTETVIMLTCCALQSACYSPTGIVILLILSQFQGEVQTNLTVKRFLMCSAALCTYSAERIIYNFAFGATAFAERSAAMKAPVGLLSGRAVCVSRWRGFAPTSSAERSKRIFTGGVVTENGSCGRHPFRLAVSRHSTFPKGTASAVAANFPA